MPETTNVTTPAVERIPVKSGPHFNTRCAVCNKHISGGAFTAMPFGEALRPLTAQAYATATDTPFTYRCFEHSTTP